MSSEEITELQIGFGKVETELKNVKEEVKTMSSKISKLPSSTHIENVVLKGFQSHEEKKHKGVDLKMLITLFMLGGTDIGALLLQFFGG